MTNGIDIRQICSDLCDGISSVEACSAVSMFNDGGLSQDAVTRATGAMFSLVAAIENGELGLDGDHAVRDAAGTCRRYMQALRDLAERSGYAYSEADNCGFAHFSRVLDGDLEAAANDEYSRALNASIEEVAAAAELEGMEA